MHARMREPGEREIDLLEKRGFGEIDDEEREIALRTSPGNHGGVCSAAIAGVSTSWIRMSSKGIMPVAAHA